MHAALLALLAALTLLAYRNSFEAELTQDSAVMLRHDPRLRGWRYFDLIFTRNYTYPTSTTGGSYRPLTTLSYWFNYTALRNADRPLGYHVVNAALHIANAALVLYLIAGLSGSLWAGAAAGALFAAHPIATEAVTNIVGRADLFAAFFTLAGLLAHIRGRRWLAWAAFAGGVLSKENAAILVPLVVLYDWLYRRDQLMGRFRAYAPNAYVGFLIVFAAWWAGKDLQLWKYGGRIINPLRNPLVGADWLPAQLTALKTLALQLWLLVWPQDLICDYSVNQIPLVELPLSFARDWPAFAAALVLLALAAVAVLMRKRPLLAFASGWLLIALMPTSNLYALLGSLMGERYLYLPSVGFCAIVALALARLPHWLRPSAAVAAAVLVGLCAGRTFQRNDDWRNETTLWAAAVRVGPNNAVARSNHALSLFEDYKSKNPAPAGQLERAIAEAQRAIEIYRPFPQAWANLGIFHMARADAKAGTNTTDVLKARAAYLEAVDALETASNLDRRQNTERRKQMVNEGVVEKWLFDTGDPQIHLSFATAMFKSGRTDQAQAIAEYARKLAPGDPRSHALMAVILRRRNRLPEAASAALESLLINRDQPALVRMVEEIAAELAPGERWPITDAKGGWALNGASKNAMRRYEQARVSLKAHFMENHAPDWQRYAREILGDDEPLPEVGGP